MTDAERQQRIGEAVEQLAEQRNRLSRFEQQGAGLAKGLRDAATRLDARVKGAPEPPTRNSEIACPDAAKVGEVYAGLHSARAHIEALGERLKDLGIKLD